MAYNAWDGGPLDDDEPCDCDHCLELDAEEAYWESLLADDKEGAV